MTRIDFKFAKPTNTGTPFPVSGVIEAVPTKRRIIAGTPDTVIIPTPFHLDIPDTGNVSLDLEPTGPDWAWSLTFMLTGIAKWTDTVTVPDADTVDYPDLPRVDPVTLEPDAAPDAAWWAALNGAAVDSAAVVGGDLIITHPDGSTLNAGTVRGPAGADSTVPGPPPSADAVAAAVANDPQAKQNAAAITALAAGVASNQSGVSANAAGVAANATAITALAAGVAANQAASGANKARLDTAADPLAYLNSIDVLCTWDTRPAGTEATFPQGMAINEAAGEIYVANQDATTLLRIDVRNLDGTLKSTKRLTVQAGAFTEALPWWYSGTGDLMFMVRTGAGNDPATGSGTYNIYNYTTGVLGPQIPIQGPIKGDVTGNYLITSDVWTNTIGKFYLYDWSTVKAGAPVLLRTIPVEFSGATAAKNQGLVLNGGYIFLIQGASNTFPTITVYNLAGQFVTAYEFAKADYAAALNSVRPGLITDTTGYAFENEAGCKYKGKLATLDVVNSTASMDTSKSVVVLHNVVGGARVPVGVAPYVHDTNWLTLAQIGATLNTATYPIVEYGTDTTPLIRRIGNRVFFEGAVKGLPAAPASIVITTLPAEWRPVRHVPGVPFQRCSSNTMAGWSVRNTGVISMDFTTKNPADATTWYPFQLTWMIG